MQTGVNKISNILLDRLPKDYDGYLIRTDFGIGIQIALCASDVDISEYEKTAICMNLLYGRGMPDFETAMAGVAWYMSCGKEVEKVESEDSDPVMSFDFDDVHIYSAFKKVYGIDLSNDRLHWFQFSALMQDLSGTVYNNILELRQTNAAEVDPKKRAEFARMKKRFSLPNSYTKEEESSISEFLTQLNSIDN